MGNQIYHNIYSIYTHRSSHTFVLREGTGGLPPLFERRPCLLLAPDGGRPSSTGPLVSFWGPTSRARGWLFSFIGGFPSLPGGLASLDSSCIINSSFKYQIFMPMWKNMDSSFPIQYIASFYLVNYIHFLKMFETSYEAYRPLVFLLNIPCKYRTHTQSNLKFSTLQSCLNLDINCSKNDTQ